MITRELFDRYALLLGDVFDDDAVYFMARPAGVIVAFHAEGELPKAADGALELPDDPLELPDVRIIQSRDLTFTDVTAIRTAMDEYAERTGAALPDPAASAAWRERARREARR